MTDIISKINGQTAGQGFKLESFEYLQKPAMRFIGKPDAEIINKHHLRPGIMQTLDAMTAYKSGFDYDAFFFHWNGQITETAPWQGIWGRFMKENAPVPDGFVYVDLIPRDDGGAGSPYISQFSFAEFSGDMKAMHKGDIYCNITRDITARDRGIPYPEKFWYAEIFINGVSDWSTGCVYAAR